MLAASKLKMSGSKKKKRRIGTLASTFFRSTYDIFSENVAKRVTSKFHVARTGKRNFQTSALHVESFFFLLIRPIDLFWPFLLP